MDGEDISKQTYYNKPRQNGQGDDITAFAPAWLARIWNSRPREAIFDRTQTFVQERPILGFFLLFQIIFAALPILVFLGFVVGVTSLALIVATLFAVFWISFALVLCLIPALVCSFVVATVLFGFTAMTVAVAWLGHNLWQGNQIHPNGGVRQWQTTVKKEDESS